MLQTPPRTTGKQGVNTFFSFFRQSFPSHASLFSVTVPLIALCCGRSGDKGDASNIGLIARQAHFYPFLRSTVTPEVLSHSIRSLFSSFF
jgi:hypothetical protein